MTLFRAPTARETLERACAGGVLHVHSISSAKGQRYRLMIVRRPNVRLCGTENCTKVVLWK